MTQSTPAQNEGKTCTKCGKFKLLLNFPPTPGNRCRSCVAEYHAEYRRKNAEKARAYSAAYYQKNREKMIADAIEYAQHNPPDPEKVREWDRLRMAALKESGETCSVEGCGRPIAKVALRLCNAHARRHYQGNPGGDVRKRRVVPAGATCSMDDCNEPYASIGLCSTHAATYRNRLNPEISREIRRRRRARLRELPVEYYTLADILARDGNDCVLCGEAIDLTLKAPASGSISVDHLECISWSDSAGDVLTNVAAAHLGCNVRRHNKPHSAAAAKRAQLLADAERGESAA